MCSVQKEHMSFDNAPFICPICHCALTKADRRLVCTNAHSFDMAREGYVNLLHRRKKARIQGDDKAMLQARRAFLQRGHYAPIAAAIQRTVFDFRTHHANDDPFWMADLGCGEGYYLEQVIQRGGSLEDAELVRYCGFDLAKDAVRMAAKLNPRGAFAVADLGQQIPLADQSMHVLLNIFAPRNAAEFARVLKPDGLLLVVIPADEHLCEWRSALAGRGFNVLGIQPEKAQRIHGQFAAAFEPAEAENVSYTIELAQNDVEDLWRMTPNYWHIPEGEFPQTQQLAPMRTTVSVEMLVLRRR